MGDLYYEPTIMVNVIVLISCTTPASFSVYDGPYSSGKSPGEPIHLHKKKNGQSFIIFISYVCSICYISRKHLRS